MKRVIYGYLAIIIFLFVMSSTAYAQEITDTQLNTDTEVDIETEYECEHLFTEYISDNNATYFADGTKTAFCDNGCGETDTVVDVGTILILSEPSTLTAITDTGTIKLSWPSVEGASGYRIYYKTTGNWKKIVKFTDSNAYELTNIKPGLRVHFAVKSCVVEDGQVLFSSGYAYTYSATKSLAPEKIVTQQSTSSIKLQWTACKNVDGYNVYYMKNGSWRLCAYKLTGTSVTFKNLPSGKTYKFAVQPFIIASSVIWGDYIEYTAATLPVATNTKIQLVSKGKINLTWDKLSRTDGYQVFYKIDNGGYKFYKAYADVKKLSFNLKGDKIYTFAVRGYKKTTSGYIYGKHTTKAVHIGVAFDRIVVDHNEGKWNLLLVNKEREIINTFTVKLADIPGDCQLDYRVAPYFNSMYSAALEEGVYLTPISGYRSKDLQLELYNERIAEYMYYGYSAAQAEVLASKEVLPAGTSEHNLGLAVDIGSLNEYFADSAAYKWLSKNAHKYGFIERYTAEKESITGIIPEAWHWRFVGVEYAEKIKNSGLCLEEYLEKYNLIY